MPTELDQRFDEILAAVTGPGGRLVIEHDERGRAIVANFPATLPGFFEAFCKINASVEAVVAGDERLNFAQLHEVSSRLARALVGLHGVNKGDRVAIAMRNCPAWIATYMAVVKAGAIATLVNGWWQAAELTHALELTRPVLIVADAPRAARCAASGEWRIVTLPIERPVEQALAPLIGDEECDAQLPALAPEDPATILFTSGSTGDSKGALSSHRAVTTGVYAYASGLIVLRGILESRGETIRPPRTLVTVPLFHVTGEVPVMLNSFVVGRGMVLMPKWDAGEALRLIEKERVTYFVGVPTMSLELMNHPDREGRDLSTLTDITAGGAPRPVAHVERLKEQFPAAQPALGYGLTETNATGCANYWTNYAAKPASTGRAQKPLVEIAILGEGEAKLATGEVGEVGIRTAANIDGYWDNPAATAAAFTADGFLRTGDIGYLDPDDYLFIVDRKKEIIIRGGENISAAEVEAAYYAHPGIAEAAVFGIPDERLGEVPVAIIYRRPECSLDEPELREFVGGRLAAFKVPARLIFVDEPLPRLGTGKIDRVTLKQRYRA